ncbi:MAG TPA: porin, partial [Microvirga sp.]|nr:porin [Microvirga sp.]
SNPDMPTRHFGTLRFDDAPDVNLLAYTYSVGNGLSISVSAEDPQDRDFIPAFAAAGPIGGAFIPLGYPFRAVNQGGYEFPDFVGNVKYAGTWGTAQISGAVHQITDLGTSGGAPVAVTRRAADDEIGFAVAGYLSVNLPMIAAGDAVWLAATYADGAIAYLSGGNAGIRAGSGGNSQVGRGFGALNGGLFPFVDATVRLRGAGGEIDTTEGFSIAGGFTHMWAPTFETNLFGSWMRIDYPAGADRAGLVGAGRVGFVDLEEMRIGGNAIWRPVSGFQMGVEVLYTNLEAQRGRFALSTPTVGARLGRVRFTEDEDFIEGRLRIQRDF